MTTATELAALIAAAPPGKPRTAAEQRVMLSRVIATWKPKGRRTV